MRTFPARTSRAGRAPGFTLIELMLVLVLLAIMLFLALPAFQSLVQSTTEREVNRLTSLIRLLRNEAVLTRRPYRLVFDLKQREYFVEELSLNGQLVEQTDPAILRRHRLPPSFQVKDIVLNGDTRHPMADRRVDLTLDTSGFMDPFALRFTVDGTYYVLEVAGFTSDVNLTTPNPNALD